MSENQPTRIQVLYVGGDADLCRMMEAHDQFDLSCVQNGYQAISHLENHSTPGLIISELMLPGMSGYALYEEIMQKAANQQVVFIITDAGADPDERLRAMQEGVDDLLPKPLEMDKLLLRYSYLETFKKKKSLISIVESKQAKVKIPIEKRTFDILFSSFALLVLSPLFLAVALAIRLESKGKVFYAAKRVGAGYKIFPFFKFRSMYTGADARLKELAHLNQYTEAENTDNPLFDKCPECEKRGEPCSTILYIKDHEVCERQYLAYKRQKLGKTFNKIKNDPRVTKVGRLIRKTSIDELPQLVNVLRGEMSIVGNRPVPLYEAELLTSDEWTERFLAPAGITGLWQVSKRGKSDMSNEERKALDNEYARNYSFWKDILIIIRTFTAFMQKEDV